MLKRWILLLLCGFEISLTTLAFAQTSTPTLNATPPCSTPSILGNTSITLGTGSGNSGYSPDMRATLFTLYQSAVVYSLEVYSQSQNTGQLAAAIYTGIPGQVGSLVVQSASQTIVSGWNVLPVPPTSLSPGTYYLAYMFSSPFYITAQAGSTNSLAYTASTITYGPFASAFTAPVSYGNVQDAIYANYCIATATPTNTLTATSTITNTPTVTPSLTPTSTASSTPTPNTSITATPSFTSTPTSTVILSPTLTSTMTPTLSSTPTSSNTPMSTPSSTLTPTPTATLTASPTSTMTLTITPALSPTPTSSNTPSSTPFSTLTPTLTATLTTSPTPTSTMTLTITPALSPTPAISNTPSSTPSSTLTPTPTATLTASPTLTSTMTLTITPALSPTPTSFTTSTPTFTFTQTPTASFSLTPTETVTATLFSFHTPVPSPILYPNPGLGGALHLSYFLPFSANQVTIHLFTTAYRNIFRANLPSSPGPHVYTVLLRSQGLYLANGIYYILFTVRSPQWSYHTILKYIMLQ